MILGNFILLTLFHMKLNNYFMYLHNYLMY